MSKLQRKLERETKIVQRRGYYLYLLYQKGIGEIFEKYSEQAVGYTSTALLAISDKSEGHKQLYNTRVLAHLRDVLSHTFEKCALEMESYWKEKRRFLDVYGRVSMSYLDKKVSPPWASSKVSLKDKLSKDSEHDPGKGHFKYYMSSIVNTVIMQIQRGALNEETPNQILQRVKKLFDRKKKHGVREADTKQLETDPLTADDNMAMYGTVDIETGFYNQDMITMLKDESIQALGLEYRQYRPWMTDELLANNKAMYKLDQSLYMDYVNLFNSAGVSTEPGMKGLSSPVWTVNRPGVCDHCDARSGLTMQEIKEKVHDEYGDKVPSLHPNCYCVLVPQISEAYKDKDLEQQGVSWDPESGALTIPKAVSEKYRLDLNLDQYIQFLSQGGGK